MGRVNPAPPLAAGEEILWQKALLYSLETTTVGGKLYVTTAGLLFVPKRRGRLGRRLGPLRLPREDVSSIGVQPRTGTLYNGGLRKRLRVDLRSGEAHLFIVNRLHQAVREIRLALEGLR